ncbi:hypothetical protein DEDE109153_01895 [Deinococcus deserti]|uniref:Uncharacterized protein n=1 Tax=Deinococcus deserti (strain DSM 17065 / CIP 109153 / LMG 22923 / VCD115) TaxID=546414 RepID=C1CV68_DEIDV|nr:hypothetical protein [Deinococcus deserti]ACO46085.1 hypothetical protein Deide_11770 [Deinococcus deserti VCD115]
MKAGRQKPRFAYLQDAGRKAEGRKVSPAPDGRRNGDTSERLEPVYVRKETVRAVWREIKKDGGESVSELVEDLLLMWLRDRA